MAAAAETLHLTPYLARKPKDLSGGQRQRVAIGRAIVRNPKVFLFDEPLSNLDAALRLKMRIEISRLSDSLPDTTMIYVTHDQVEAMTMADRIVVLKDGEVQQVGSPMDLYNAPQSMFVAQFIGSPADEHPLWCQGYGVPGALRGRPARTPRNRRRRRGGLDRHRPSTPRAWVPTASRISTSGKKN